MLANRVCGRFRLTLEVGLGQPQRRLLAGELGVHRWRSAPAPSSLRFPFVDLFLDSRFRVYEAFTRVAHK